MRQLIAFIFVLFVSILSHATDPLDVQNFEGEARMGMTQGLGWHKGMYGKQNITFGVELRQNIKESPIDVGLMVDLNCVASAPKYHPEEGGSLRTRVLSFAGVTDYNFLQGHKVNPFFGLGIGVGGYDMPSSMDGLNVHGCTAVFVPRVGVELLYHIRLTGSLTLIRKGFNSFNITLGLVIGGRPK